MTSYRRSISLEMPIHNTARMLYFPELPLFPSSKAAIEEYLDTRLSDSTCIGSFFGLAPDYRGRIWKVKLSTKGVQATIQCPFGSDAADLAAKVYASKSRAVRLNTAIHRSLTEQQVFPRMIFLSGSPSDSSPVQPETSLMKSLSRPAFGILRQES